MQSTSVISRIGADAEGLGSPGTSVSRRARRAAGCGATCRVECDSALAAAIDECSPSLIVLAGFMRILSAPFVKRYAGKMLNIHPSLLPKYPGLHTHRRAIEAGDKEHGATVHFVTEELDGGPRIIQARVPGRLPATRKRPCASACLALRACYLSGGRRLVLRRAIALQGAGRKRSLDAAGP